MAIEDRPLASREDLSTAFASVAVGTPLKIELKRGKETLKFVVAAVRPSQGLGLSLLARAVGITVTPARGRLSITDVVRGSAADRKGLRPGDLVLGANGQEISDPEALGREVLRGVDRGGVLLLVQRGRFAYNLGFAL